MPLRKDTLYTIHNDLTHTVLDMSDEHVARGWGWHGKRDQQWKLVKGEGDDQWKLLNQLNARYLSRVADHANRRLIGVTPAVAEAAPATATFVIQLVPGPSERYRIKFGTSAVTLVTGTGVEDVGPNQVVHDLQTDGPPIVLRPVVDAASIWSFRPVAKLPLADGTYQIVNSRTGTALGVHADNRVQGQPSQANQPNQKWIITKDTDGDSYTFKNSRPGAADRFLGTYNNVGVNDGIDLQARGAGDEKKFTIRKVPDTNYYKIFSAPPNENGFSRLAVNLRGHNQAVTLQAAPADTWSFN
ncbi:hypothetical protein K443DRAFT_681900 [Laccaria amethystina LaAM-08-1]|uniref:Ricin B lectin domain-containing protein n=1 Tax=Laccaria amethystina LaAM-08-1 TaxID=1095629 RepID=A0A0C9XLB7_9AGAR|nr:hypothetical protein K443DRAFT_681900 [Laccaria amethystina LaAM-08-1]